MIEIAQHIESLLLENDCVIIPEFGGFVAHHSTAKWIKEEGLFLPPTRIVGFNPQLKMNDGLLVQSYMQVYHTSFSDASKLVNQAVDELVATIRHNGKIDLHGVGELVQTINNTLEFHPYEDGVMAPELYGLSSFEMTEWKEITSDNEEKVLIPERSHSKEVYEIKINRSLLRHTVAAAAAIIIFFFLSTPVENTYVEKENYAQLLSLNMFETINSKSMVANTLSAEKATVKKESKSAIKSPQKRTTLKPRVVRVEKVHKATPALSVSPENKGLEKITAKTIQTNNNQAINKSNDYCIIVASVANTSEGQKAIENLKKKGYLNAHLVEGGGRIRIGLMSFSNKDEANRKISEIRQNPTFKDAWLLSTK